MQKQTPDLTTSQATIVIVIAIIIGLLADNWM